MVLDLNGLDLVICLAASGNAFAISLGIYVKRFGSQWIGTPVLKRHAESCSDSSSSLLVKTSGQVRLAQKSIAAKLSPKQITTVVTHFLAKSLFVCALSALFEESRGLDSVSEPFIELRVTLFSLLASERAIEYVDLR